MTKLDRRTIATYLSLIRTYVKMREDVKEDASLVEFARNEVIAETNKMWNYITRPALKHYGTISP